MGSARSATAADAPANTTGAYARLSVLAAGLFTVGTNAFVIAGLLPQIADSLKTSQEAVAFSITIYAIVVAVASPAVSLLLPHVPRTALMAAGLFIVGIGTAVAAFSDSLTLFTAGRVLSALGGAALVPAATAAAPALLPPSQHGKALAVVGTGVTLATALGSPAGTALGDLADWRLPMVLLAGLSIVLALIILFAVRHVPLPPQVTLIQRVSVLRDRRVVMSLFATAFLMMAFNIVYVFSAVVAARPTGGSGTLLSVLLLAFGLGGILGNAIAGPITDRLNSRAAGTFAFLLEAVALAVLPLLADHYIATVAAFAIWGVAATGVNIPVQHRLIGINPAHAGLAMSWYSTAMYGGLAIAPLVGTAAASWGGAPAVPVAGALAALAGLGVFQLAFHRLAKTQPVASQIEQSS